MPTPFTHLQIAQRLLDDDALDDRHRLALNYEGGGVRGAFLLGSVAADARVGAGIPRDKTHFYGYGQDIVEHPWQVMLRLNPGLRKPHDMAHRAFIAGYVAHLAVDEYWSQHMVAPHFFVREWGDRVLRFLMLHIILIVMDERDLTLLLPWQSDSLKSARPERWLPFISDTDLALWQKLIYEQIRPGGQSETLVIFGQRINRTPDEMRAILDSPAVLQSNLWDNISQSVLAEVEDGMYQFAREQMRIYLDDTESITVL